MNILIGDKYSYCLCLADFLTLYDLSTVFILNTLTSSTRFEFIRLINFLQSNRSFPARLLMFYESTLLPFASCKKSLGIANFKFIAFAIACTPLSVLAALYQPCPFTSAILFFGIKLHSFNALSSSFSTVNTSGYFCKPWNFLPLYPKNITTFTCKYSFIVFKIICYYFYKWTNNYHLPKPHHN